MGGARAADPIVPRGWRRASWDCLSELAAVTKDGGTLRKVPHHVPEQKARRVVFRLSFILSLHLSSQTFVKRCPSPSCWAALPLILPPSSRLRISINPVFATTLSRRLFLLPFSSAGRYQSGERAAVEKGIARDTFFSPCSACWVTSAEDADPHPRFLPHVCKLGLFGWLEMICIVL